MNIWLFPYYIHCVGINIYPESTGGWVFGEDKILPMLLPDRVDYD
jgi:hypothetical protein